MGTLQSTTCESTNRTIVMRSGSVHGKPEHVRFLNAAPSLDTLRSLPGNHLEALLGDRMGQYSIRLNRQWRLCFEWPDGQVGPDNVEIVDYHG